LSGCLRVLLSNLWWERWLLKFLELSGVGRAVKGGADKEKRATQLDGWDTEERVAEDL
jgi:hypothetical protein